MSRNFERPDSGKIEKVDVDTSVLVFFFGPVYLAFKRLWAHVLGWLFIAVPIPLLFGDFLYYFSVPITAFIYAASIQSILIKKYQALGWKEVTKRVSTPYEILQAKLYVDSITSTFMNPPTEQPVPTRPCQFCSAVVSINATKCSHCHSDLFAEVASL